jgi:dUTPase
MKIGIAPQYVFKVVDKLSTTERNNGGFGSTGV